MKKILILIVVLISTITFAQDIELANRYYAEQKFDSAKIQYEQLLESTRSAVLYYNYANSCFKTNEIAKAILYYEKALKIEPRFVDAKFNLEYANQKKTDKIATVERFFIRDWWDILAQLSTSNDWTIISISLFIISLALLIFYLFSKTRVVRKIAFIGGIAIFLLSITTFFLASKQNYFETSMADAIIMEGTVTIKSSPAESGTDILVLHDGTKVTILSTLGKWAEVKLADGNVGWMKIEFLERI